MIGPSLRQSGGSSMLCFVLAEESRLSGLRIQWDEIQEFPDLVVGNVIMRFVGRINVTLKTKLSSLKI